MVGRSEGGAATTGIPRLATLASRCIGWFAAHRAAWIIFVGALAVRLIYLYEIHHNYSPDLSALLDQRENLYWARTILHGDIFGRRALFPEAPPYQSAVFYKPPLYPYLVALLLWISGGSLLLIQVVQAMVGSFSCVLVYRLAQKLGTSEFAARLAAVGVVVYGPLLFIGGQILPETFYVVGILLFLLSLVALATNPSIRQSVISGLLLGGCILLRPNLACFLPLAGLWLYSQLRNSTAAVRVAQLFAIVVGCAALCVLPVAVRNYVIGRDRVVLSYYDGYNFLVGNNEYCAHGLPDYAEPEYWAQIALKQKELGRDLKASEMSAVGWKMGFDFIREHPKRYAILMMDKLYRAWNAYEPISNQSVYFMGRYSRLLSLLCWRAGPFGFPFGVIAPLGLIGLVDASRDRQLRLAVLFVLSTIIAVVLFFVTFRHRIPMIPLLLILAARGAEVTIGVLRHRRGRSILLALIGLGIMVNSNWDRFEPEMELRVAFERNLVSYTQWAADLMDQDRYWAAAQVLSREIADRPEDPLAERTLAWLFAAAPPPALRNGEVARTMASELLERFPQDPENLDLLAAAQAECGDFTRAVETAERASALAMATGRTELSQWIQSREALYVRHRPFRPDHLTIKRPMVLNARMMRARAPAQ